MYTHTHTYIYNFNGDYIYIYVFIEEPTLYMMELWHSAEAATSPAGFETWAFSHGSNCPRRTVVVIFVRVGFGTNEVGGTHYIRFRVYRWQNFQDVALLKVQQSKKAKMARGFT